MNKRLRDKYNLKFVGLWGCYFGLLIIILALLIVL